MPDTKLQTRQEIIDTLTCFTNTQHKAYDTMILNYSHTKNYRHTDIMLETHTHDVIYSLTSIYIDIKL